jgi:predicted phage-related endonuclease
VSIYYGTGNYSSITYTLHDDPASENAYILRFRFVENSPHDVGVGFRFDSLDGELERISTGERGIYEGKTTEIHGRSALNKWEKRVPDYYYVQVLHQLVVTGWSFEVLKAQLKLIEPDGNIELLTRHYPYQRSELLDDLRYLYLEEKDFWGYVERRERPPLKLPSLDRNT